MNVITLSDEQLLLLQFTVKRDANVILEYLIDPELNHIVSDLLNDRHDELEAILKELNDCKTPKVIKPSAPQQTQSPEYIETKEAAAQLGIDDKTLYNRRQAGKLKKNKHWRQNGRKILWNVETVRQWLSENSH